MNRQWWAHFFLQWQDKRTGQEGFDFKVLTFGGVEVGGDSERQEQQTHKITLSLKVVPNPHALGSFPY